MAPGRAARATQSLRTSQQQVIQRRVQQVRQALQHQQQANGQVRGAQSRVAQQRQQAQQRRASATRIWQRTAAKRAARQVETEQAILERERRIADYERERQTYAEYVRRGHRAARAASELSLTRTEALAGMLRTVVAQPLRVDFADLKRRDVPEVFDAGGLDLPLPAPRAEEFEPTAVRLPTWVPGQRAARDRAFAAADEAYRQADLEYRAGEVERVRKLSAAKLDHQRRVREATAKVREYNVAVDRLEIGYRARERSAVERYAQLILTQRAWPAGMRVSWRLRYVRDLRQLDVECVLPGPDVVPSVRRYRYAAASDAFRRQAVPAEEIRARYAAVVHQSVLCALADLFGVLSPDVVDVVQLNARVDAASPAGRPIRPHVVSIATARAEWAALRLARSDPAELLRQLDARISPDPSAAVGIEPWADFDS